MGTRKLHAVFPVSFPLFPAQLKKINAEAIVEQLKKDPGTYAAAPYLCELAEIELMLHQLRTPPVSPVDNPENWRIRPGVELIETAWSGLPELLRGDSVTIEKRNSLVLFIPGYQNGPPQVVTPDSKELLALKLVAEKLDPKEIAQLNQIPVSTIYDVFAFGVQLGLLEQPPSGIKRTESFITDASSKYKDFLSAGVFTLQWHITHTCDLHCRHCYDRSIKQDVLLEEGIRILDQLYSFCNSRHVRGQVTFTGGNPLLHPNFSMLYTAAADRGFMTAILGNPTKRKALDEIVAIQPPEFYQVSLEGLQPHNDYIRGKGHFERVIKFLPKLRDTGIYSMVMLTLTRDNKDEVLPLAKLLKGKVDLFTFNRLAMVGEGAALASVDPEEYKEFLIDYMKAASENPVMSLKDNLFNILRCEQGLSPGGGCAGHGCGAAFNFVSLLPDGQVHACRKLPSIIGNLAKQTLEQIYEGTAAKRYRAGCSDCANCEIRPVCGGCLAVTYGFGENVFESRDPYCFRTE